MEKCHAKEPLTLIALVSVLLPFINFYFDFFLGHNFQTIEALNLKLQILIAHIKEKCSAQEP